MSRTNQIVLHSFTGQVKKINLYNGKVKLQDMTVEQLKNAVVRELGRPAGLSPDMVKLIVVDKPLDNDSAPLSEYGVKEMTHVQIVRKVHVGGSSEAVLHRFAPWDEPPIPELPNTSVNCTNPSSEDLITMLEKPPKKTNK